MGHRDLKPENIMLNGHGQIVILDWGMATTSYDSEYFSAGGGGLYKSPELFYNYHSNGKGLYRIRAAESDAWSLGVLLFNMVVGRQPFEQGAYDADAKFTALITGEIVSGTAHTASVVLMDVEERARVPVEVQDVIDGLLTVERATGYVGEQGQFWTGHGGDRVWGEAAYSSKKRWTLQQAADSAWLRPEIEKIRADRVERAERAAKEAEETAFLADFVEVD